MIIYAVFFYLNKIDAIQAEYLKVKFYYITVCLGTQSNLIWNVRQLINKCYIMKIYMH